MAAAVGFFGSVPVRAQVAHSPVADSVSPFIRTAIESVAGTAGLTSLRDSALAFGARREVRAYVGFGLMSVQQALRVWEDDRGAHGWLGLWWAGTRLRSEIPNGSEAEYMVARRARAAAISRLRERIAELGCAEFRAEPEYETCTLLVPDLLWTAVLARLDSLGVARLPQQPDQHGLDGVTLVVEYRDAGGYRAYSYWMPGVYVSDPDERSAAAILEMIGRLPCAAGFHEVCGLTTR